MFILCTRSNICYAIEMIRRYQSNPELEHWTVVRYICKYLRRTRNYILVYEDLDLILVGYTDFISCQTWISENHLLSMCSQGLRAHRTESSTNMRDSTTWRHHSY